MFEHLIEGPALPTNSKRTWIHRVKTTVVEKFIVLSPKIMSTAVHYLARLKRTVECKQATGFCTHCHEMVEAKWKGYLHCVKVGTNEEVFLEMTADGCMKLGQLTADRQTLRGSWIEVSKTSGGARGRYKIDVKERTIEAQTLPEAREPWETLRRLWSMKLPIS